MATLADFVEFIKNEANELASQVIDDPRKPLNELFENAIAKTLEEIKAGASSEDFPDFVVINMIIDSAHEGYVTREIKDFVNKLTLDRELS